MIESIKDVIHLITVLLNKKHAYSIKVTTQWLKDRIKHILSKKEIAKVAVIDMGRLIEECLNQKTFVDLYNDGYSMLIVSVDFNGKVDDIEIIAEEDGRDQSVAELLGEDQMIVFEI